jgi:putative ABC transport system permease protein
MKVKENPSLILAFHGMRGRKKQTSLLLILLTMVFSFLTAATIYSGSSAQALQDTRCELYGEWQYLRLSDTDTDAAQVRDNLPASAKVSTAIQNGIVLGADNGLAGGIGTVDSAFAQLGRIVPISGNFPAQPDEIAMTTTLLDALGCSYDLGQTITLKVADNDYDPLSGSGKIVEQTYTLCGVLPAYDVYWNLGSNLTVSAVVAEPLALAGQKFQTFYDLNADTVGTASDDPDLIANEYAYPQEDTVSSSLTFLLMIAILVSFFAVAQYFVIVLHKRVQTLHTFQILGARKQDLHRMCLWEALFAGLAAVFLGFALGCGAAAIGLGLQKQLSFFAVPFASLILLAVLFLIAVLLSTRNLRRTSIEFLCDSKNSRQFTEHLLVRCPMVEIKWNQNVVPHRILREQPEVLKNKANFLPPHLCKLLCIHCIDVLPIQQNVSGRGRQQSSQDLQKSGFPAATGTNDGRKFPLPDRQVAGF